MYFRKETEPYMTVAIRSGGDKPLLTVAELNLKFIWDVVSRIKIGDKGKAYVVDASGLLIADPDIGVVLRKTNLGELAHVKAAAQPLDPGNPAMLSHDQRGTPVLAAPDDVYTNHVHAQDLARALDAALWRGRPQRAYNACDDTELKMGDYFDLAAELYGLPRPPRLARDVATQQLPLMLLSFMSESRRLSNARMKKELRLKLLYPTVVEGLQAGLSRA